MGCTSSTQAATAKPSTSTTSLSPKKQPSGTKTDAASASRTSSSTPLHDNHAVEHNETETTRATCSKTLQDHGNFFIRYACLSRQGQDADCHDKPNQDAYAVQHKFCNNAQDSFFCVLDGHGPHGEKCSSFVQERLPTLIHHKMQQYDSLILTTDEIQTSLHQAHTQCNDELHALEKIDDSSSGTTSISVYLQGDHSRITISNVGDSRAILGTRTSTSTSGDSSGGGGGGGDRLRAVALSTDHTPHQAKEAQRCIDSGARILTFGQILPSTQDDDDDDDSDVEDPPRVWSKTGKWPGTAFTRSIGDSNAETLGVFAEPEMLSLKLSEKEKVIVLCSDGIFDVMTNQQVIDKCYEYYFSKNPSRACKDVVEHAHQEWLVAEECVDNEKEASFDDMTIACIFVYNNEDVAACEAESKSPVKVSNDDTAKGDGKEMDDGQHCRMPRRKRARQKTLRNLDEM